MWWPEVSHGHFNSKRVLIPYHISSLYKILTVYVYCPAVSIQINQRIFLYCTNRKWYNTRTNACLSSCSFEIPLPIELRQHNVFQRFISFFSVVIYTAVSLSSTIHFRTLFWGLLSHQLKGTLVHLPIKCNFFCWCESWLLYGTARG